MTDMDFDEIDKAVNSAIGHRGDKAEEPQAAAQSAIAPAATAPVPRAGKFMDFVPPSSNAKVNIEAPEQVSREAKSVEPTSEVIPEEPKSVPAPAAAVPEDGPATMPDPIDFHNSKIQAEAEKDNTDNNQTSNNIDKTPNETDSLPESPFVPGAKIEKRPLGAFSDTVPTKALEQPAAESKSEPEATPEVTEGVSEEIGVTKESAAAASEQSAETTAETSPTETTESASATNQTVGSAEKPTGPESITQQYREQPSTGNQESGAIYDTSAYHKAVLKPTKKGPNLKIVIWILLLLLVGAGAGVAAYYLVLPHLSL